VLLALTRGLLPEVAHARDAAQAYSPASTEWSSYGGGAAQDRFSPLSAINPKTIRRLGPAWFLDLPNETNLVATPLMVNGLLYFTGKFSVVYAVDARTGKVAWSFDPKAREELANTPNRMSYNWGTSRGVAYWKGTIVVAAADGRLISLAEKSGKPLWSVQTLDPSLSYLSITGAPLVFGDRVLIGNAGGDFGASRGYVTAYSAVDGRELWRTFTVPGDPARGYESEAMKMAASTWGPEWWKTTGGGNL
jgi:quinohemoprotein ethanol dehydrogenase